MNLLQRWLIVHSIIYYVLDENKVTDAMFDANSVQLVKLMEENPDEVPNTRYYYMMHDWDGSTGMHLFSRLNDQDSDYLFNIAMHLIAPPRPVPPRLRKKKGVS